MTRNTSKVIPIRKAREVVRQVIDRHPGVVEREIFGRDKRGPIMAARRDAYRAVAQAFPDASFPQLGRVFDRHHATIMNGLGLLRPRRKRGGAPR